MAAEGEQDDIEHANGTVGSNKASVIPVASLDHEEGLVEHKRERNIRTTISDAGSETRTRKDVREEALQVAEKIVVEGRDTPGKAVQFRIDEEGRKGNKSRDVQEEREPGTPEKPQAVQRRWNIPRDSLEIDGYNSLDEILAQGDNLKEQDSVATKDGIGTAVENDASVVRGRKRKGETVDGDAEIASNDDAPLNRLVRKKTKVRKLGVRNGSPDSSELSMIMLCLWSLRPLQRPGVRRRKLE